jgi:hypothetical protein
LSAVRSLSQLAALTCWCIGTAVANTSAPAPPAVITAHLADLKQVDRFVLLPPAIRDGHFTVDGTPAAGWQMAEPGAAFSATDVPVPGAPGRRLIFAACDARLCLVHYERGGIAHFYEILTLLLASKGWTTIWNVRGAKPFANLAALRAFVQHPTSTNGWTVQWVKGDF